MTYDEYLFTVANEESVEIAQAVDKALRFGVDNHHPNKPELTNEVQLLTEYYQLQAVVEMLIERGQIKDLSDDKIKEIKDNKILAIEEYAKESRRVGRLVD